jgi:hypothetical protein
VLYQAGEDSVRFSYQLCGCVAAALLLLCAATARASIIPLPAAQYNVEASSGPCNGFNCSKTYDKQLLATEPATLQVGCSADVGAPNCAGSILLAAPAPFISVEASTSLNNAQQNSNAEGTVTYYYEVLCPTCAPGTLVPMSIGGFMEAHFIQGTGGTVAINALDRIFVNGYNPVTSRDNVLVYFALQGSGATSTDLTIYNDAPVTGAAPNGFGFCESTWTGFHDCTGGPSSPYGVPVEVRANEVYSIFLDAAASVQATNQPFSTSSAEVTLDPVISFGPGFDSTGYSIAVSPGIGNQPSTVPEPATWMLLSTAVLGWGCARRLRRVQGKRSGVCKIHSGLANRARVEPQAAE